MAVATASFQAWLVADVEARACARPGWPSVSSRASVARRRVSVDASLGRPRVAQTNANVVPAERLNDGSEKVVEVAARGDVRPAGDLETERERWLKLG
jgi:hypothetical protein